MLSPKQLGEITYAKIHPAIGIARIGTSPVQSFLAPEVPNPVLNMMNQPYRDRSGALARQAVRFRVYGYKQVGGNEEVVGEITGQDAVINWTVHVANAKSAWFGGPWEPYHPLDLQPDVLLSSRHPNAAGPAALSELIIDSGPVSLSSSTAGNPRADLKGWLGPNSVAANSVTLGTISLNPNGELIFEGGTGLSGLMANGAYADFDDVSDGSVDAAITIGGQPISCTGAWVVGCPPSFAPGLKGVRTLYDLLLEKAIAWGWVPAPAPGRIVSFPDEILPIFQRLSRLQWTSQGFAVIFGQGQKYDFLDPQKLISLRQAPPAIGVDPNLALRQDVFQQFRKPGDPNNIPSQWPPLWGDAADDLELGIDSVPDWNCSVSLQQWGALRLWANGQFNDVSQNPILAATDLNSLPVALQPAALDCASLSFAGADAFHPGLDLPWVIRVQDIYSPGQPFRIRKGNVQLNTVADRPTISFNTAKAAGMFTGLVPGGLTCWLAVPWQCDLQGCSIIQPRYQPKPMAWWPARVPDFVQRGPSNPSRSDWFTLSAASLAIQPQSLKQLGLVLPTRIPGGEVNAPPIFVADR